MSNVFDKRCRGLDSTSRRWPIRCRPEGRYAIAIALSLQQYLDGRGVPYEVMTHDRTLRSSDTAQASAVPENNLAKGVLMKRKDGYLLAILPAACHVQLGAIGAWL